MAKAAFIGVIVFAATFVVVMAAEKLLHKVAHNPGRSYRWGVWVFAVLAGVWAAVTNLGR